MALSPFVIGQNWLCVNAAAEGWQRRTEMMERMQQQEVQVKESRWMEETPQRWRQPKGADRTEMRKEEKRLKCTLIKWVGLQYREEVHEKIQRQVRYLLWDRAQLEEGGNGGTVKQRGKGRMEVCVRRGENHG